ncbi:hypothetical protein A2962_00310 [Candidatus Woesebacteria bacterium RIFCSPLOWO2_01_FULL_39_61]|uniref:Transcription elongation factor GreA/GreB C-terminal domain-containing protein n=1 Tax=Candidatus Woesebacteria bacterium RIFCSPHIGHO2_02_FULL_39_13 TaxID=1802505 RepID=A0A1F7YZG9_9BACT|nr:MAG: hypothetical protein A2692_05520 [Candidatus Woesebacteria bacterium RIFCSPHIGHO2_01_FULL_39_95]OGM32732.1 MAG: hypothetical protein A3D01_00990 [Candidatus Woesebacteria bacterium RIFCSPHIGHO2_02_FULL_39_13]OGM37905.1 MAG: hypothetical protein A3E13_04340 [Candidatus Woesebacteria bacterium RIFCSPHIGHO2_12_FULL_40_20]OGM66335.1 MAG: hypothetical protein A2962_00310 [Candidatus Woesebacteria bacterium RIFCSPLOWO2_01_FULL_39_61]OGM75369.1 MAG: hypothetical protein A3H19_02770 [Candidatus
MLPIRRLFKITELEIHRQIENFQKQYIGLGEEARQFDQDGDTMHDPVVYRNQLERQRIEVEIENLSNLLKSIEYIAAEDLLAETTIQLGHKVELQVRYPDGESETMAVVLGTEVDSYILGKRNDLETRIISETSPLGKAIRGRKIGEEFATQAPGGNLHLKILEFKVSFLLEDTSLSQDWKGSR